MGFQDFKLQMKLFSRVYNGIFQILIDNVIVFFSFGLHGALIGYFIFLSGIKYNFKHKNIVLYRSDKKWTKIMKLVFFFLLSLYFYFSDSPDPPRKHKVYFSLVCSPRGASLCVFNTAWNAPLLEATSRFPSSHASCLAASRNVHEQCTITCSTLGSHSVAVALEIAIISLQFVRKKLFIIMTHRDTLPFFLFLYITKCMFIVY
jgi:hypothetical protein